MLPTEVRVVNCLDQTWRDKIWSWFSEDLGMGRGRGGWRWCCHEGLFWMPTQIFWISSPNLVSPKIQTFISKCLRQILHFKNGSAEWVPNAVLWTGFNQAGTNDMRGRDWPWIGPFLRKEPFSIPGQALEWNPQGKTMTMMLYFTTVEAIGQ